MGSLVNAIRNAVGIDDEKRIKERLNLLLVAAKGKIRAAKDEINLNFSNPEGIAKMQVPGIRAIKYIEQYHVASSSKFNEQVADHLEDAIDAFFAIGGKDKNAKEQVQSAIKSLIHGALEGLMGSTQAGESEERLYVVIPENNAFIRADIYIWRYNFEDKSLAVNEDTGVAYVLCKSVIDHTKLTLDELIYLSSQAMLSSSKKADSVWVEADPIKDTSTQQKIIGYDLPNAIYNTSGTPATGKFIKTVLVLVDPTTGAPIKPDGQPAVVGTTKYKEMIPALGDSLGEPPSIANLQAYIDELVTVWKHLKEALREEHAA